MIRFLLPITVLAVLVGFLFVGLSKDPSLVPSPLIGKPAPDYELPLLDNPAQTLGTRKLMGQIYLVNIWGTWCPGCRIEHDTLLAIAESDVVPIYGLNWKDDPAQAIAWLAQLGDPFVASMFDASDRIAIDWGAYGAPETFLIDQNGIVVHKQIGSMTMDIWTTEFLPRINELRKVQ